MSLISDWRKTINDFRRGARKFLNDVETLRAQEATISRYPQLADQYDELMERSETIYNTIVNLTSKVDKVAQWLGVDTDNIEDGDLRGLNAVGFLIPIAVVAAAVAAMGKWASDVYIFNKRLDEIKRLESRGMSPEKAAAIAIKRPSGIIASLGGNVFRPLVPILIVGAGLWALSRRQ